MRKLATLALLLVVVGMLLGSVASAQVSVPKLTISAVASAGANPGVGGCLTYPLIKAENGTIFGDLGMLMDGDRYDGFFGLSTDYPLPIVKSLPGDACVGVGFSTPSDTWMVYLRYAVW